MTAPTLPAIRAAWFLTDAPVRNLAARFGLSPKSLRALARKHGWPGRNARRSASLRLAWQRRRAGAS